MHCKELTRRIKDAEDSGARSSCGEGRREASQVLLLDGLPRNRCPLANTPAQGTLQDFPGECWQEGAGRRRDLGGVTEGT